MHLFNNSCNHRSFCLHTQKRKPALWVVVQTINVTHPCIVSKHVYGRARLSVCFHYSFICELMCKLCYSIFWVWKTSISCNTASNICNTTFSAVCNICVSVKKWVSGHPESFDTCISVFSIFSHKFVYTITYILNFRYILMYVMQPFFPVIKFCQCVLISISYFLQYTYTLK